MTRRLLTASLLGVALLAAACSSTASTSKTTVTTSTTQPVTTTTAASTAACTTTNLAISVGQSQGAAGHIYIPILFKNVGSTPCTMGGFPGVAATTSGGQQAVQATRTSATATTITVPPGSFASAMLVATDVPSGTATTCPTYPGILVTPPNTAKSQALSVQVPGCSAPTISPVILGSAGQ
jgi:hypothetical protein